uniref:Up-regulated during septation-domain-containing protein n=1 Tax=Globodera pallida TaxID=36090 RepID=A0A183C1P0_GLOPA
MAEPMAAEMHENEDNKSEAPVERTEEDEAPVERTEAEEDEDQAIDKPLPVVTNLRAHQARARQALAEQAYTSLPQQNYKIHYHRPEVFNAHPFDSFSFRAHPMIVSFAYATVAMLVLRKLARK